MDDVDPDLPNMCNVVYRVSFSGEVPVWDG